RRYIEALRSSSLESFFTLVTDPAHDVFPPLFQRIFICFEGVKRGWVEGCRRVLCVDGCFLKTFLGGQFLAAVGRDANEQMYPLC
ncbi:Sucrose synthase, partial [Bienertia sinuspersici]